MTKMYTFLSALYAVDSLLWFFYTTKPLVATLFAMIAIACALLAYNSKDHYFLRAAGNAGWKPLRAK